MNLFVLGDPHLSFGSQKPMDIFGSQWQQHDQKIKENWLRTVKEEDTILLAGDISWAMNFDELKPDFAFIHALPGQKIILKGNHDYWWTTMQKMQGFCAQNGFDSIRFLHNNTHLFGDLALCGTRGWSIDAQTGSAQDQKVFAREILRLEASLKAGAASGAREIVAFLHYPPLVKGYVCEPILELLLTYKVSRCYYGHLHGQASRGAKVGEHHGIRFSLISCDNVEFCPVLVPQTAVNGLETKP